MANRKVSVWKYVKIGDSWRYKAAAYGANGKIKPDVVIVDDTHRMIFAHIDTPAELCVERVKQRRIEAGNPKPFNPEKLLHKYESILKSQEKLRQAGYDARILPHEEPLQTLLRWFAERS